MCFMRTELLWLGVHVWRVACNVYVLSIAACAHVFYKAGAKVILCARRVDQLERVKRELQQLNVKVRSG